MPVHGKILRVDKEKAKYCYLTFSVIISFFGDNFSPKRLTAARAMLHWTRTKGKNREYVDCNYMHYLKQHF